MIRILLLILGIVLVAFGALHIIQDGDLVVGVVSAVLGVVLIAAGRGVRL